MTKLLLFVLSLIYKSLIVKKVNISLYFQAMVDVSADEGWLSTVLRTMLLVQMVIQGRWIHDCPLLTLPGIDKSHLSLFRSPDSSSRCIDGLPELAEVAKRDEKYLQRVLNGKLSARDIDQVVPGSCCSKCVGQRLSVNSLSKVNFLKA